MIGNVRELGSDSVGKAKDMGTGFIEKIKGLGIGGGAIILLGFLSQLLFPWWSIAIVAFYVGFWVYESPTKSFVYGTAAVTLLWLTYAMIQNSMNTGIISSGISNMLDGKLSVAQLMTFTGVVGGLVGGFSAMTGTMLRHLIKGE
jgi:hypothetical protein